MILKSIFIYFFKTHQLAINYLIKPKILVHFIFSAILFEDAILLGAENDTLLYTSDTSTVFSLPFCQVERTVNNVFQLLIMFIVYY